MCIASEWNEWSNCDSSRGCDKPSLNFRIRNVKPKACANSVQTRMCFVECQKTTTHSSLIKNLLVSTQSVLENNAQYSNTSIKTIIDFLSVSTQAISKNTPQFSKISISILISTVLILGIAACILYTHCYSIGNNRNSKINELTERLYITNRLLETLTIRVECLEPRSNLSSICTNINLHRPLSDISDIAQAESSM